MLLPHVNVGNLKVFNIITLNITLEDLESARKSGL